MNPFYVLNAARVNGIMQGLTDIRQLPQQLTFLNRTAVVPALDSEVMARYIGRVLIADIIANDNKAAIYQTGKLQFESTVIPNLKIGRNLTQEEINQWNAYTGSAPRYKGADLFTNFENRIVDEGLLGVRQRMEQLIIAMQLDSLTYDRLGIKIAGTWGMPSDLNIVVGTDWSTAGSADGAGDILAAKRVGTVRYGQPFDRATMSYTALNFLTAQTLFQNRARIYLPPSVSTAALPLTDPTYQKNLVQNILGLKELEIYDARYWQQNPDGGLVAVPFLPINKVILSYTGDDNDPNVMDFANAVVTESIVSGLVPGQVGKLDAQYGPIAYPTLADAQMNPPGLTYWSVARGFPRKHRLQATAALTVGTFVDTIPVTEYTWPQ